MTDKRRCNGCGTQFEPTLDGDFCPTCVDVLIRHDLEPGDFDQHRLLEEYGHA